MTRTYQFYTATSQANAASIQMIANGRARYVWWAVGLNMEANNDLLRAELSYQATSQMAVHNPLGIISAFSIYNNLVTSGMTCAGFNGGHACDCIIKAGEIIYLNTSCTGSFDLRILLLVNEGA